MKWALSACFFYGIGNFGTSLLAATYGTSGVFLYAVGQYLCFILYYLFSADKITEFYSNRRDRQVGVLWRALIHFTSLCLIIATFMFATWANVNQGVIGGLFTANIFYSSVIFYLVYGEKISCKTVVAMCLLFGGVFCVSVRDRATDLQIDYLYLLLSVLLS